MKHLETIFHFAGEKEEHLFLPPDNWGFYGLSTYGILDEPPNADVGVEPS